MNKLEVLVRVPPADIGAERQERMCIWNPSYANCTKQTNQPGDNVRG